MNEVEELQGLESACRLCLTTDETRSSIFGVAYNVDPLIEKIQNCLSLQISQEDKLSTLICITCVNKVNQWHQYKKECLQSQDKLLKWFTRQSEPLPIVTVKKEPEEEEEESMKNSQEKIPEKISDKETNESEKQVEPVSQETAPQVENLTNPSVEIISENGEKESQDAKITETASEANISEIFENTRSTAIETENVHQVEPEARESVKRRLSQDFGNENATKRFNALPIKAEPTDDCDAEIVEEENHLNPNQSGDCVVAEVSVAEKTQKAISLKGKKRIRRGPHTHFRGAKIFKRKCLHCQINLHSKTSYAKHMARFHSKSTPKPIAATAASARGEEEEETEEMIEDVEEELENLEEDAPLTPVQQNIISQLKTFTCYSCEQSFQDRRSTLNHIRQHMPDLRTFTCVACLTEFADQSTYKQHCEASFECAMKIALVVPVQGTEKYFTCNMCLLPMSNRKELLSHLTKHSDKQYEELMSPSRPPPKLTPMTPLPSSLPYGMGDPAYNHECDLCGMIYRYKPNMVKHRELCASLQPEGRTSYKCIDCGMTFLVFNKFHSHVVTEHKKKELKCPKCAAKFRSPSDYLTHHEFHRKKNNLKDPQVWSQELIENESSKKLSCNLCSQLFSTRAELTEHKNLHLKLKIYSCVICRSMFSSAGSLEIHMKDHGIDDPSERTANSACLEYSHEAQAAAQVNSAQVKSTECIECGKIFSNVANLRRHIRNAHGDERRIECAECNRSFKNKESLDEHQRIAHNSPEKTVLTCPECPKTFVFQANLDLHVMNVHANQDRGGGVHECELCGKSFAEESSLKIHRGWHNRANSRFSLDNYESRAETCAATKPAKARKSFPSAQTQAIQLQCQVCDDKFNDVGDLRKHVWDVHCARTAKKEMQCEMCSSVFPDQQTLQVHIEWHERNPDKSTGQFRCDICDKYYSSHKILWRHKKLHKVSQVPSYQRFQSLLMKKPTCNGCGRQFSAESALKRHKAMSPECHFGGGRLAPVPGGGGGGGGGGDDPSRKKPVTCHICKTVFPSMSILYQHKQLVHKTVVRDRSAECVPISSVEGVKCNICGKHFSGVSNLKQHFAMKHKSVTTHPCTVANCSMIFSTPHALKSHELQHSNMIYSCTMCEKHFFHRGIMEKHIYNTHRAICQSLGEVKDSLFKETDLTTYTVRGANGTVCPRCKVKYPNIKAMKIHYFKFHETLA